MSKYLKKFNTHQDYEIFKQSEDYIKPNVSYCIQENEVHYKPIPHDYSKDYFTIVSLVDNNEIYLQHGSSINGNNLSYSLDGVTWTSITFPNQGMSVTITTLNTGEKVMFKGTNNCFCDSDYYPDVIGANGYEDTDDFAGNFDVEGNIMSLINGDDFKTNNEFSSNTPRLVLGGIFQYTQIHSAENLILPTTILTEECYRGMFQGSMLSIPPKVLPATTLGSGCYSGMFQETRITESPYIPNITYSNSINAFDSMFYSCYSLNRITCLVESSDTISNWYWVYDISQTGTFIKNPNTQWTTGNSGIPSGWTVETAS